MAFAQQTIDLEQCQLLALKNNAKLKESALRISQSTENKKEALTKFFPTISATGTAFNANKNLVQLGQLGMLKDGYMGSVTVMQPIFAGGQIVNGNKLAKLGEDASLLQQKLNEKEIYLIVENYYWQLVSLSEKIKTIDSMDALLSVILKDAEAAYTAGVANRNDVLQVNLKKNSLNSTRLQVENGIKLTKMLLAQYIGLEEEEFLIKKENYDNIKPAVYYLTDHNAVLQTTNEHKLLDNNVQAQKLAKKIEIGKILPSLAVGGGWIWQNLMGANDNAGVVMATVSIPISGWWGGSHTIKKQLQAVKIAEIQKQDAEEMLVIGMQKGYNDLEEAYKQVFVANESIIQANENLRLNSDYYKAGTISMSDLLEAESLLQQSLDQYTENCTKYFVNRCRYLQSTGRTNIE